MKIVVDAGHGGKDPGACGNGLREAEITLLLARGVVAALKAKAQPAIKTRGLDAYVSLPERVRKANNWGADLFVSLHCNAAESPQAHGVETLCYSLTGKGADYARKVQRKLVAFTGLTDRGVKARPGLYVLKRTNAPAILVELGFVSNPADAKLLKNQEFILRAAGLIAQAALS